MCFVAVSLDRWSGLERVDSHMTIHKRFTAKRGKKEKYVRTCTPFNRRNFFGDRSLSHLSRQSSY
jgi:hypothetical protein